MQAFLVSHPRLSIPDVGSNMWTYFYQQYGDLSEEDNFERCLAAMLRYKHVRFLQPDPERIRREFWQSEPTYGRLFALFQQHHAERANKPRWGVQTGLIERYADEVMAAYPGAKIIHMIRDPRDRYQASLALWPNGKGRAGGATSRWGYSVALANRNLNKYPNQYKVVRYETLVRDPVETLKAVCDFIGEPFDPEMLTMSGAPKRRDKLRRRATATPGPTPLSDEFIGSYKGVVDKLEIAFLQHLLGKMMQQLDYELDPIVWSLQERVRYGLYLFPANYLRHAAWRALEAAQHNLPQWLGRRPDKRLVAKTNDAKPSKKGIKPKIS